MVRCTSSSGAEGRDPHSEPHGDFRSIPRGKFLELGGMSHHRKCVKTCGESISDTSGAIGAIYLTIRRPNVAGALRYTNYIA